MHDDALVFAIPGAGSCSHPPDPEWRAEWGNDRPVSQAENVSVPPRNVDFLVPEVTSP